MISTDWSHEVHRAIVSGSRYVMDRQSPAGSWTEWQLPPGQSCAWATAAITYKLRLVPDRIVDGVERARRSAAQWLFDHECPLGGWGYNEMVGSDADSTALAILSLSAEGFDVPTKCYRRLLEFQRIDGGFATYVRGDSWGGSHPDVSPIAVLALLTRYDPASDAVARGVAFVLGQMTSSGLWNSFWWLSPLYATEASLALLRAVAHPVEHALVLQGLGRVAPRNAFDTALLILSLINADRRAGLAACTRFIRRLVEEQELDGSWKSEPILRVTRQDCFEPWNAPDAGAIFSDPSRLFTSSTVLEALSTVASMTNLAGHSEFKGTVSDHITG